MPSLDEWWAELTKEHEFDVPGAADDMAMLVRNDSLISAMAPMVPPLYAYGSWPWTIQRELLLPFDREASSAEWRRLYNDPAIGPLACLAAAECTAGRDAAVATAFAERGKERLTREALQRDLAALVAGDAPMPRWTKQVLARFRDLPAADAGGTGESIAQRAGTGHERGICGAPGAAQ